MRFFRCPVCGKIVMVVHESEAQMICCGQGMEELMPGETDGAYEKHVPEVTVERDCVYIQVGSVLHPMTEAHHIVFIALETTKGVMLRKLKSSEEPRTEFMLCKDEKPVAAYEYCNLHGLWKKDI